MSNLFSPISELTNLSFDKASKNINENYAYLMNNIRGIIKMFKLYYPLELLKLSLWDERKVLSREKDQEKIYSSTLLPILLQSVLISTECTSYGREREVKNRDWERIKTIAEDSVRRIVRIIDNVTAREIARKSIEIEHAEEYRRIIESRLLFPVLTVDDIHSSSTLLRSLLEEKEDFSELCDTDFVSFSINTEQIAKLGLCGIDDLCREVQLYSDEYRLEEAKLRAEGLLDNKSEGEIFSLITEKNHWENRADNLTRTRDGFSLFMVKSATSLPLSSFDFFTSSISSCDIESCLRKGYWPVSVYPFVDFEKERYSFVGKYIPYFISTSFSLDRGRAAMNDVLSIFHNIDDDTFVYDGKLVEITILPSLYEDNLFLNSSSFEKKKSRRREEEEVKSKYGHKRIIVDPDARLSLVKKDETFIISASYMYEATINKNTKHTLLNTILGNIDLPLGQSVYSSLDEDEVESSDKDSLEIGEEPISDEYEYEYNNEDEDKEAQIIDSRYEKIEKIEYEKKDERDIDELKDKYSLTAEIIERDEENEKAQISFNATFDEYEYDDRDENERLDDIGPEKEEDEFFDSIEDSDYEKEEESVLSDDSIDNSQLDFLSLLDEDDAEIEIGEELEKEDEESFIKEEERAEELDSLSCEEINDNKEFSSETELTKELEKEDEDGFVEEEEREEELDSSVFAQEESEAAYLSDDENINIPILNEEESATSLRSEEEKEEKVFSSLNEESVDEKNNGSPSAIDEIEVNEKKEDGASYEESIIEEEEVKAYIERSVEDEVDSSVLIEEEDESEQDEEKHTVIILDEKEDDTVLLDTSRDEEEIDEGLEGIIYDIYKTLGRNSVFASLVKDSSPDTLEELESIIQSCWNRMQAEQKDKLFNIPDYSLSIMLSKDTIRDELRMAELINNAGAVMYSREKEMWNVDVIYINSSYTVEEAFEKVITKDSFSPSDWKRVTYISQQMRK